MHVFVLRNARDTCVPFHLIRMYTCNVYIHMHIYTYMYTLTYFMCATTLCAGHAALAAPRVHAWRGRMTWGAESSQSWSPTDSPAPLYSPSTQGFTAALYAPISRQLIKLIKEATQAFHKVLRVNKGYYYCGWIKATTSFTCMLCK